jgi:type IX secretion system PorP/SprF family membrane protein
MPRLLTTVFALVLAAGAYAQDPIFSQYYAMPLQVNPGFTGSAPAPRVGIAYRHQWTGFNAAYRTYAAYYEQSIDRMNSGIGLHVEGDNAGDGILRTNRAAATYAYQLNITEGLGIKLGVEAGVIQTSLAWDKLIFPDQLDPIEGGGFETEEIRPDHTNRAVFDVGAGMLLLSERFYVGAALKHLNTPDEGILIEQDKIARGLPLRYAIHGGTEIVVKKGNKRQAGSFISPNFLFVSQGPFQQINVGAYASMGSLYGGAWFRHTFGNADAAILLAGFRQGIFKIGLSYDLTVSGLAGRSGGTYELTIGLQFDQTEGVRRRKRSEQLNDCLRMFQ